MQKLKSQHCYNLLKPSFKKPPKECSPTKTPPSKTQYATQPGSSRQMRKSRNVATNLKKEKTTDKPKTRLQVKNVDLGQTDDHIKALKRGMNKRISHDIGSTFA